MSTMEKTAFIVLVLGIALSVVHGQCPCNSGNGCNQNQNCGGGCGQNQNCGGSCAQNQNYNGGVMNTFGQPVSAACQGPLPCYDVVLTYVSDGPLSLEVVNNEQDILPAYARAGIMRQDFIAEGRKAVAFFRDTFGVDLSSMPDSAFLSGRTMNAEGVEFRPWIFSPTTRYRMYMATTKAGSQLYNRRIYDQGWMLNFTRPMWGRGTFRKLIPEGAFALYAHYIIHPCGIPPMDDYPRPTCTNILNPQDPWAPIVITYKSPTYVQMVLEPYPYIPIDIIAEHPVWGQGRARSIIPIRDGDLDANIIDSRNTLTFPGFK